MARYQHGNQRGCLQGTRETVLNEIKSWVGDFTRPPIFWLNGLTGTGKSAIAQTVMEWCDAHGKLQSSVSCSCDVNDHDNLHLIFPALAIQLAQKDPKVQSILVSLLRSNPDIVYESPSDQVEKLIVKPLKLVDIPAVIVIDAFDEQTDSVSQSAILHAVEYWTKEIPKVKFLIISRGNFHLSLGGLANVLTLHNVAQDLVDNDIRLFLKHELSGLAIQKGLTNWPTDELLDELCDRAGGLFVYAVATVKFFDHKHTIMVHSPDNIIHEGTVGGVHRGLNLDSLCISIFQASFRNNDDEDDTIVRLVLATMVLATHPLPPSVIANLISLEIGEVMSILRPIQSLLRLHEDPSQPVWPFHKLLSDLLTSPTRCTDKRFYISPGKFHSEIALNCRKLIGRTLEAGFSLQNYTTDFEVALKYAHTSQDFHHKQAQEIVTRLPMSPLSTELPSSKLHEALVRQWCFTQATPPTPGVFSRGGLETVEDSTSGVPGAAAVSTPTAWWMGRDTTSSGGWFTTDIPSPGEGATPWHHEVCFGLI
jgi:hypothetical protein